MKARQVICRVETVNFGWGSGSHQDKLNQDFADRLIEFESEAFDLSAPDSVYEYDDIESFLEGQFKEYLKDVIHEDWSGWSSIIFYFDYSLNVKAAQ